MWEKRRDFTSMQGCSALVSKYQYICMKLPKTDDNNRTHKNDTSTLYWYMVNASFQTSASQEGHSMSIDPSLDMIHLKIS